MDMLAYDAACKEGLRLANEVDRLRAALQRIADLPAGSKGAYGKFVEAICIARETLAT